VPTDKRSVVDEGSAIDWKEKHDTLLEKHITVLDARLTMLLQQRSSTTDSGKSCSGFGFVFALAHSLCFVYAFAASVAAKNGC
jgi:hypothetical protein